MQCMQTKWTINGLHIFISATLLLQCDELKIGLKCNKKAIHMQKMQYICAKILPCRYTWMMQLSVRKCNYIMLWLHWISYSAPTHGADTVHSYTTRQHTREPTHWQATAAYVTTFTRNQTDTVIVPSTKQTNFVQTTIYTWNTCYTISVTYSASY